MKKHLFWIVLIPLAIVNTIFVLGPLNMLITSSIFSRYHGLSGIYPAGLSIIIFDVIEVILCGFLYTFLVRVRLQGIQKLFFTFSLLVSIVLLFMIPVVNKISSIVYSLWQSQEYRSTHPINEGKRHFDFSQDAIITNTLTYRQFVNIKKNVVVYLEATDVDEYGQPITWSAFSFVFDVKTGDGIVTDLGLGIPELFEVDSQVKIRLFRFSGSPKHYTFIRGEDIDPYTNLRTQVNVTPNNIAEGKLLHFASNNTDTFVAPARCLHYGDSMSIKDFVLYCDSDIMLLRKDSEMSKPLYLYRFSNASLEKIGDGLTGHIQDGLLYTWEWTNDADSSPFPITVRSISQLNVISSFLERNGQGYWATDDGFVVYEQRPERKSTYDDNSLATLHIRPVSSMR